MIMHDSWLKRPTLIDHLADQLIAGRLGLFLGAGVSSFFKLPDWKTLIEKMAADAGEPILEEKFNVLKKAEALRINVFSKDPEKFKKSVKNALYDGKSVDFDMISLNPLLSAIGSLVMASQRGSAAKVITLNFDNLLELYLEYHGFTTAIVHGDRHWAANDDVVIYHPHGYLPIDSDKDSKDIVLGTKSFHDIIKSETWRPILETALRQHTFLYLGLSGEDMNLHSHWTELKNMHAIKDERILYHGVRFEAGSKDKDLTDILEDWGIFTHELASYDDMPKFLFEICQVAREKRQVNKL